MTKQLTQEQKARIYCVKNGHAKYVTNFFGYVYCGRCGEQLGDKLASIYPDADKVAVVECEKHPCKICDAIIKKLSPVDKEIFRRLVKDHKKKKWSNREEILKGLKL